MPVLCLVKTGVRLARTTRLRDREVQEETREQDAGRLFYSSRRLASVYGIFVDFYVTAFFVKNFKRV